jgi:hypothetical protein
MNKSSITLLLVLLSVAFVSGCLRTTPDTYTEREFRTSHSWELDSRMLVDDFDYILLIDRNSTLSQWHQRTGY